MKKHLILIADDDEDFGVIIKNALDHFGMICELKCVEDGEVLMDYLLRRKEYADPLLSPVPELILLDINMPKKTGLEVLREIRADPSLCTIPVIMLTASDDAKEVAASYGFGANSFVTKPAHFHELNNVMKILIKYWFKIVTLPDEKYGLAASPLEH